MKQSKSRTGAQHSVRTSNLATNGTGRRGRPKGRANSRSSGQSFGPLGDLIRAQRLALGLGLSDIADACSCSVQFVSNIEHGRAPLPWEKVNQLASVLKIAVDEIQAANLSIRSDFKSFIGTSRNAPKGKRIGNGLVLSKVTGKVTGTASAVALAAKDAQLREVIQRYQIATPESRKRFVRTALQLLSAN